MLFNIYNDCNHNKTLDALTEYHRQHKQNILRTETTQQDHHLIWLGDFNRHHPYWDRPEDNRLFTKEAQEVAEVLLKAVADLGMDIVLAKGTPTQDQVFITEHSMDTITACDTVPEEQGVNTDHLPIIMVIDVELTKAPTQIARNFRDVDWKKFHEMLEGKVASLGLPNCITTHSTLNCACEKLTHSIQETKETDIP
jgi:hypothetical protein